MTQRTNDNDPVLPPPAFRVGDRVEKYTGDYRVAGEVRAVFTTIAGATRYVVEIEAAGGGSFLHIYGPHNLRAADRGE